MLPIKITFSPLDVSCHVGIDRESMLGPMPDITIPTGSSYRCISYRYNPSLVCVSCCNVNAFGELHICGAK